MFFSFDELSSAPLVVDAIYEGGWKAKNIADEPLSKLFAGVGSGIGNSGGFRKSGTSNDSGYCVLFTTGGVPDWPDQIDLKTGCFTYFGDNKKAGRPLSQPSGNKLLEDVFSDLHSKINARSRAIPFLIFEKYPTENSNRSVRFRGLAVAGYDGRTSSEDLVAVWRSNGDQRFQNYRALFSILDEGVVSKEWLADPSNTSTISSTSGYFINNYA